MAKRPRVHRDPHYWVTTRVELWCARGEHMVGTGTRIRYRRDDHRMLGGCEDCLKALGVVGPRKVTLNGTFDVRAKRAGDE